LNRSVKIKPKPLLIKETFLLQVFQIESIEPTSFPLTGAKPLANGKDDRSGD